ncbi:MAG TPA: hypothetical protein VFO10_10585 [Oligoflexus sp.]|uniref:hypothetical protein n=1 Tax=Oligoflexus sp. TaxID=1971216 RepID=UPI002D7ED455|nr:hypothetical protein [Oligoflexus sp.]HET9237690.1 hypothetical protein [Oligoflexus sp.]
MTQDRLRIRNVQVLSSDYYTLRKTTFDFLRSDGTWQTMSRESYDRGNGAAILLYNRRKKTVILTRQFRYPAFGNGSDGFLIEVCAGVLDENDPEGGGKHGEGEDIEVLEMPLAEALQKIRTREIMDGKTIMLLQHLELSGRMKD